MIRIGHKCDASAHSYANAFAIADLVHDETGVRTYNDYNYASCTGWALQTALSQCGEDDFV